MADEKITGLSSGGGAPAEDDLFVAVDVSDTTMDPSGTDKKYTTSEVRTGIQRRIVETGDFTLDPDVHTDGCVIVTPIAPVGTAPGTRAVTLPVTADQPAVGYTVTIIGLGGSSSFINGAYIAISLADGDIIYTFQGRVSVTYVGGANAWEYFGYSVAEGLTRSYFQQNEDP